MGRRSARKLLHLVKDGHAEFFRACPVGLLKNVFHALQSKFFGLDFASTIPREARRRTAPGSRATMGAFETMWENSPRGKPVAGSSLTPLRSRGESGSMACVEVTNDAQTFVVAASKCGTGADPVGGLQDGLVQLQA